MVDVRKEKNNSSHLTENKKMFSVQSFNHSIIQPFNHSIYLALTILLLITINSQAQVVIKEKVEINPQSNIVPEYPVAAFTPCGPWITSYDYFNPWQVVWNQISFAPDPYQQMFNFQDNRYGPGLQRRIYTLDPNKHYNVTIQQEEEYAYFTYGGFYDDITGVYVPTQYVGTALSGVPGSDIGATAWFNYAQDYPNGLYRNDSKYRMRIKRDVSTGTEITMTVFDGQETINYHTRVEVPTFTIESRTDEDTLLHYYSRDIEFILNFQQSCQLDGYGEAYPEGIKFNVEIIQGQEYGNLYYPGTVAEPEQSGISITNLEDEYGIGIANYTIKYKADGVQPDSLSPGIVTIRCSANDIDIAPVEVSFPVKYNEDPPDEGGYIIVGMDKQSYEPGDTAVIFNRWLTGYGEDIYFPVNQLFDVEITAGIEYGVLYDPYSGEVSGSLQNVLNGFRILISSSIAEDSVVIILKVRTRVGGGISTRMITNEKEETERGESKEPYNTESIIIGEEELEGYGKVLVKKDGCDDLNSCVGFPYPQFVQYKMVQSGIIHNNPRICDPNTIDPVTGLLNIQTGGFSALDWRFERSQRIDADACYDNTVNRVRFKMNLTDVETNQNSLILKPEAILEICEYNISNAGLILISDTTQFKNIITQFPEQIPILKADMDSALSRYGASVIKYKFRQEIVAHETEHKKDYESWLSDLKPEMLDGKIMDYTLTCSQFKSNPYATDLANVEYLSIVKEYIEKSNREASKRTDELVLHQRLSIQTSLFKYYNLLYKFESGVIF